MAYSAEKNDNGTIKINRKRRSDTSPDSGRQIKKAHLTAEPEEGEVDDPETVPSATRNASTSNVPFPFKQRRMNPHLNVFTDKEKEISEQDKEHGKEKEKEEDGPDAKNVVYERPPAVAQEFAQKYPPEDSLRPRMDKLHRDSRRHHERHRDRDRSPRPGRDYRHSQRYPSWRSRGRSPSPEISASFSPIHHTYDLRDGRERLGADCYRPGERADHYPSRYDTEAYASRGYDSYRPGGNDRSRDYLRDRDRDRDLSDRDYTRGYDRYVPSFDSRRNVSPSHSHRPVSPANAEPYRPISPSYRPRSPDPVARPKSPHTPPLPPSEPPPQPPLESPPPPRDTPQPPPPPEPQEKPRQPFPLPPKPQISFEKVRDPSLLKEQRSLCNPNQWHPQSNGELPSRPPASWDAAPPPPPHAPPPDPRLPPPEQAPPNQQEPQPRPTVKLPWKDVTIRSKKDEAAAYGGKVFSGVASMDDYELMKKVGEGTFGEVHKARHKETGAQVALKRILMHNEKEGMPITALREIKILKSLHHKNIIEIRDMIISRSSEKDPLSVYMVFPYMDHDLAGLLENERVKLQPSHVKLYMKQLVEGTEYMHRNKILHRDMKAANLLISNDGTLKIADFGLARCWDGQGSGAGCSVNSRWSGYVRKRRERESNGAEKCLTNCVVTRWYRPPELLLGARNYGGEVDMWGIGCVLAEMFMRKPIFPGNSDLDQLDKIFSQCGTPHQVDWPNYDSLPGCEGVTKRVWGPLPSGYVRKIKNIYENLGAETVDLLDKLLTLNPANRITAASALDHNYFWSDPMPADPKTLPSYEASHEFDKRGQQIQMARHHEQQRQAQQQQRPPMNPRANSHNQPMPPVGPNNYGQPQHPNMPPPGMIPNKGRPNGPPVHMGQPMLPPSHLHAPMPVGTYPAIHGQMLGPPPTAGYGVLPHMQGYHGPPPPPLNFRGPPHHNQQQRHQQSWNKQRHGPQGGGGGGMPGPAATSNALPPPPAGAGLPKKPTFTPAPPSRPSSGNDPSLNYG